MKQFMEMEKDLMEENQNTIEKIGLLNLEEMIIGLHNFLSFLHVSIYLFFIGLYLI